VALGVALVQNETMDCYLFSRRNWPELPTSHPTTLATDVFFQMWRTRAFPYNRLCEKDVVYIGDTKTRQLYWEVRVTYLLRFGYSSTRHALGALRSAYGMYSTDLNEYHQSRTGKGWLLAWSPTVMRRLTARLPDDLRFGQNGYRLLLDSERLAMALPRPKPSHPLATPPTWYNPGAAQTGEVRNIPRYIPRHVREQVFGRDGGRCVGCGVTTNLHLDHITPHSHGGASTIDNLRLVCAASNLARGAGDPGGQLACAGTTR
jgi:5-methylcytosine-specific restriction endonuclease McrA